MRTSRWVGALLATATMATLAASPAAAAPPVPPYQVTQLTQWFNAARGDYQGAATLDGNMDAGRYGYTKLREEAKVGDEPDDHGSVPLYLYYSANREDNFLTATPLTWYEILYQGYRYIRIEGYVYPVRDSGMVPIYTYWNAARQDNLLAANPVTINEAIAAGYTMVRLEGYVFPAG